MMKQFTKCILLVDDDENIRSIIKKVLQQQGYEILEAVNGVDAIRIYEQDYSRVNLVITDIQMPEMDGWEFIDYLNIKGCKSPVLVITAQVVDEEPVSPNVHILLKPHRTSALLSKVKQLLL